MNRVTLKAGSKEMQQVQPPQSPDAEQMVLGALLKDPDALNLAVEVLESEGHFYTPRHQTIYRACLRLYAKGEACDITTVANFLQTEGLLEQSGGRVYLVELVEGIASTANVTAHAQIVLEKSILRQLISTSTEIARSCYGGELEVNELLDQAEANIFNISQAKLRQGFVPLKSLISQAFEQIEGFQHGTAELDAIRTGYSDLDNMTQGLRHGDLIVVAGRPSMGKSALAVNIAEHVAINLKRPVAIFSIEMSSEQLAMRMLCGRARLSQHKLRSKKLSDREFNDLTRAGGILSQADILIDDSPTLTTLEMRAKARRLKGQYPNLGLIVVDYMQMMHSSGKFENRQQEISVISRSLKVLAKELSVPVLACSQLSRAVEQRGGEKRPQLADLRESGAIEQDADVVMMVYRPEAYMNEEERRDPKNQDKLRDAEINIAKQRNGPTGTVHLVFIKEFARFENADVRYKELPPEAEPVGSDIPF